MRIEIVLFLIAAAVIFNIYTDGKFLKSIFTYKKYFKMAGVGIAAIAFWWLLKKNPNNMNTMIATTNDYIKYLPIDKTTSGIISPILDFTSKHDMASTAGSQRHPIMSMFDRSRPATAEARVLSSGDVPAGMQKTKRSVSETKKKFVAARQSWTCGDCGTQLNAWFEVDHKVRLEHGGSNHVDNLVALCRECHGKKTTIENL